MRTAIRTGIRTSRKSAAPPSACTGNPVGQSDFPLTPANDTDYCLTENVTVNSGTAIDASNRSNVNIDLNGYTLTFGASGFGEVIDLTDADSVALHGDTQGGTIQQGGYSPASGNFTAYVPAANAVNCRIRSLSINLRGIGSESTFIRSGSITNRVHDNTISIGGWNQFAFLRLCGWVNHDNIYNISSFNTQNYSTYSRIFERCGESYGNTVDVSADCVATQLWGGYGSNHRQTIHHNTIHYRANTASSCRIILLDSGANGWLVEENKIFVYAVAAPTYIFRLRSAGDYDCYNNEIRYNSIDTTAITEAASGLNGFSLGDNLNTRDNRIHHNHMIGPGKHVDHYGGRAGNNRFYCNDFDHREATSSYLMRFNGTTCSSTTGWLFSFNRMRTTRSDGSILYKNCSGGTYTFCANDGFTGLSQVAGQTNGLSFTGAPCADGSSGCFSAAGATW